MAAGGRATVEVLALDAKLKALQPQIDQAEAKLEVNAHNLAHDRQQIATLAQQITRSI